MKIGGVTFKNGLFLAPMAGFSDPGLRALAVRFGADAAVTEMVSAKGLVYDNKNTFELLGCSAEESIRIVQLFSSEPEFLARAIEKEELAGFHVIDLNCGCPMPKIVNNGDGSALLRDLKLLERVVAAGAKAAGTRPFTVKLRAGIDGKVNCAEAARVCVGAGAAAVTVHGRLREQYYTGCADFSLTEAVKRAVAVPVIHSGDVTDYASYTRALNAGADGVMIGRAALGRPWIFSEILDGRGRAEIDGQTLYDVIIAHMSVYSEFAPRGVVVKDMRKHYPHYFAGRAGSKAFRNELNTLTDYEDVQKRLREFFAVT